nr:MAG TPA: hypothetical protein [Caudoviricetes sp.]
MKKNQKKLLKYLLITIFRSIFAEYLKVNDKALALSV